ncbi:MAG: hypothetical protein N2V72_00520 [Methanophagales archaeon]|nr:hypothetical protein [Methanophagales archaeon]
MSEVSERGVVAAWGLRLQVPASILRALDLRVGDQVEWLIEERKGERVAILKKSEKSEV